MKKNYSLIRGMATLMFSFLMFANLSAQLYINEFMASNDGSFPGPQGDNPDWIEIYNAGSEAVMLGGYYMSDILDDPTAMYQIPSTQPDSVTVDAGDFILFYANKLEATSVLNLNFKLSAGGEQIGLWNSSQELIDELTYGEQTTDVSYGRMPDGSENWQSFIDNPIMGTTASPGKSNITLKINELLAKNDNGIVDEFGNHGDWIELYNYGETEVDITGMFMSDIPDNPTLYSFNPTVIQSDAYLLIWCDGTDVDIITVPDTLHADFKLGAGGETITLSLNKYTIIDSITFGAQTADISFGRYPDGTDNWVYFTVPTPRESNTMTAGALISDVTREPMFPEFNEEVIINANVTSSETGLVVMLKYSVGQGYIDVQMLDDGLSNDGAAGDDVFGGAIPAKDKGTYINWYIEATDDAPSISFYPTEGAAGPLSYRVTDWSPIEVNDTPFAEPSGLAYNAQTGTLFTNNDGPLSNIHEISTSAELLSTLTVDGTDFEGIGFSLGFDTIFVVEEANWKVIMYNLSGDKIGEIEVDHTPGNVNGLEGITIDPETGHIYVLAEKSNPTLIELTVDGVELNRIELDFSPDVSGITIHPIWNTLFIVSDEASSLNEVTKDGEFLRSWYIPLDQAEGVTFGEDEHTMYMVADRGGKLYKFDFNFDPFIPPTSSLFINEFMASNDGAFPGPQGDNPDWIEIFNAGEEAVMLGGYYMSDILDDPTVRYQIPDTYPDSVTIEAGGFILLYANKGQETSVLNLNFKLSASGEGIGLWSPDQIVVDTLTYGSQITDTSYGRYTDGTNNWFMMPDYTPGESNRNPSSVEEISDNVSIAQNYPNPFSYKTNIQFTLKNSDKIVVKIYDIRGTMVSIIADDTYSAGTHNIVWDASNLQSGYYFYTVQTSKGIVANKASVIR